jgi:hypothetical protein
MELPRAVSVVKRKFGVGPGEPKRHSRKPKTPTCWICGKPGHKKRDRRKRLERKLGAIDKGVVDALKCLKVHIKSMGIGFAMVDTGAEVSLINKKLLANGYRKLKGAKETIRIVSGDEIECFGIVDCRCVINGFRFNIRVRVIEMNLE